VTPLKGLDIRPLYAFFQAVGPTASVSRGAVGGIGGTPTFTRAAIGEVGGLGLHESRHTVGASICRARSPSPHSGAGVRGSLGARLRSTPEEPVKQRERDDHIDRSAGSPHQDSGPRLVVDRVDSGRT
jgi:hypothetical protein